MQEIKKWWKKVKLGEISTLEYWYWAPSTEKNTWYKYLRITDITSDTINFDTVPYCEITEKDYQKYKLNDWDIVIARTWATAWYAKLIKNPYNLVFAGYLIRSSANRDTVNPIFLWSIIESSIFKDFIDKHKWWAAQPHANVPVIKNFSFLLPPLPTQQKIASILSKYDDLIENNNKRIKILEETAQSIYEEWFVKYNFPWSENIKMIDSGNDDFGMIPEGWEVWRLEDYVKIIKWISYKSTELSDSWFPFVNLKCFNRWWWFRRDWIKWFTWTVKLEKKVFSWDLVMAVTDMTQWREIVARVAMIPNTINEATISCDVIKIEPKNIDKSYLYYFLRFSTFSDNTKMKANWANVLHLSPSVIGEFDIILPEKNIIKNFWIITEKIISEMDNLEIQNQNLKETRDLLIPRLVNGELDVESLDVK